MSTFGVFGIVIGGIIIGLLISWYKIWQWEEVSIGKKIYQFGQGKLMYIGDQPGFGAMYYDGFGKIKFQMRGMWHVYKNVDDNEQLLHLKGFYTYGYHWPDIWLIWSKGMDSAADVVRAAKHDIDCGFNHAGAQEICNMFLWVRNFREHITLKVADYVPFP